MSKQTGITDVAVGKPMIRYTENGVTKSITITGFEKWMREVWCGNPQGFVNMGIETQGVFISMYNTYLNKVNGTADDAHLESERDSLAEYTQHKLRPSVLASAHNGHISDRALEMGTLMNIQGEEDENNFMAGHWNF